ncbi:NB-ARC domain-containing protein [Mesorhizobium sp.]|uniref:NB-ARC domain-containing protein n=1 Tax=Mesorhizobium sp. TaxID=1871066 RepID=UPI003BAD35C3
MLNEDMTFFDKDALLYRLHEGLEQSDKDVVFVLGAPLTAPCESVPGVADVNAVVELIRSEFSSKQAQLEKLDATLKMSTNIYQSAFDFLSGRAGQDAANRIIKRAVGQALVATGESDWTETIGKLPEDSLRALDADPKVWHLSPGVASLGALIARFPDRFGQIVLTSNFDPLVEVSVVRSGGAAWRTSLSVDGSIFQSTASGCQVIHIHGFWHGTDTLHTNRQLIKNRPTLKNDLLKLLQNKIVVVIAYGGWPDIFTGALSGVVSNDNLFPEILWTFYGDHPSFSDHLYATLQPGIDRNRVTFYKGINCHEFFPELLGLWDKKIAPPGAEPMSGTGQLPAPSVRFHDRAKLFRLPPLECDRPPSVEIWVGRENELRALETSSAKVVIICGIGGEGKSVLAAHYITTLEEREGRYRFWDWRDCKEQSDRIRTQIVEIIVRFSNGTISADGLADAEDGELVEVLIDQIKQANAVLVFDNVDSYVDLENRTFTGIIDMLIQRMSASDVGSRIILTCRPDVQYSASSVITFVMKGISEDEAIELFAKRAPNQEIPEADIREAHALTKGHAFWLDLLAVQVTKVPGTTLRKLLNDMRRGREDIPDVLSSIWDKLALREQTLLRFMAEAVRPETEKTIEGFAASQLNYKNFSRALRSLISLNLIVVKPETDAPDLYDLHPLVRQFVRAKFERTERTSFIRVVINQYELIIGTIESMLGIHLPFPMLERWSQKAELEVSAGLYEEAFETLVKVEDALIGGGHVQEYVRVGRLLFESIDWETAPTQYKRFDKVVGVMVGALDQLGDTESADSFLARYEDTIPQKTARYIQFCDVRAYSYWQRGDFDSAVDWAMKGVTLKSETNVDTEFDCRHTLALAQRDVGQPAAALDYFRQGFEIEDFVAGTEIVSSDGAMFGNVGRCLHFMGRLDEALACYKRSMAILEKGSSSMSKSNGAYARRWIGQILAQKGDTSKATAFFVDAIRMLGASAPVRVRQLCADLEEIRGSDAIVGDEKAARIVSGWMRS